MSEPISTSLSVGAFLGILGAVFSVFTGVIVLLVRTLNRSTLSANDTQLKGYLTSSENQLKNYKEHMVEALSNAKDSRESCEDRCKEKWTSLDEKCDDMRDRWEAFMEKFTILDATRGQKVEALFRNVDEMKSTIRELRPALSGKVEESLKTTQESLKLYIRDYVREALQKK